MAFKYMMGVDMSKNWFHYCLMDVDLTIIEEGQITNTPDAIHLFLAELSNQGLSTQATDIFMCVEHTGRYVNHLVNAWLSRGYQLSLIHAPKVSEGLRGKFAWQDKEDALDARRLAEYGIRFQDQLQVWQAKPESLVILQALQRQRERLLLALNTLEVPVKEAKEFETASVYETLKKAQQRSTKALKSDLKSIEIEIEQVIASDGHLKQLFKLITSVEGIGPVTAREVIIATGAFTEFLPNQSKAFARYTGVIPHKKQSGKSVRKKGRIGKQSHKKLKSLLTMGALSLIGNGTELSQYYQRKKAEGKHHFSVINAMRNKMILRIFAVVRNQHIYVENLNNHLAMS